AGPYQPRIVVHGRQHVRRVAPPSRPLEPVSPGDTKTVDPGDGSGSDRSRRPGAPEPPAHAARGKGTICLTDERGIVRWEQPLRARAARQPLPDHHAAALHDAPALG